MTVPRLRSYVEYVAWLLGRDRVRCLPEAVSFRTRWEENYWHCHDEVLSKLILVERMGLPGDIPLLIGPRLWNAPFFQEMRSAAGLRERNWIVHDTTGLVEAVGALCPGSTIASRTLGSLADLFRDADADASVARATDDWARRCSSSVDLAASHVTSATTRSSAGSSPYSGSEPFSPSASRSGSRLLVCATRDAWCCRMALALPIWCTASVTRRASSSCFPESRSSCGESTDPG